MSNNLEKTQYGNVNYWNNRYKATKTLFLNGEVEDLEFDWLCRFKDVENELDEYIKNSTIVVDLGCGNSQFSLELVSTYKNIFVFPVDFSSSAFELLSRNSTTHREGYVHLEPAIMDARNLAFSTNAVDLVVDKGCLDAIMNDYDYEQQLLSRARPISTEISVNSFHALRAGITAMHEILRVLRIGGVFFLISLEPFTNRRALLGDHKIKGMSLVNAGECHPSGNYIYIIRKLGNQSDGAST